MGGGELVSNLSVGTTLLTLPDSQCLHTHSSGFSQPPSQSQSSKNKIIKKGWEGQRIFKSFKIEGQEEDTLQKIQKEN